MDSFFCKIIEMGCLLSPELVSLGVLCFSLVVIFILKHYAGFAGLYVYNALAVCLANVQILIITKYSLLGDLPLGTVLFTTTFFVDCIITEQYGKKIAQKGVLISFIAYTFFSLSMVFALAHSPTSTDSEFCKKALRDYNSIKEIFVPLIRILVASITAFIISSLFDIWFLSKIKEKMKLGLSAFRQGISMFFSGIIDHVMFTFLAFYVFAKTKPSLQLFVNGYITGSYFLRFIVIIFCVIAGRFLVQKQDN